MERDDLERAALEAEYATGVREPTVEAAKRHIALRIARMGMGFAVLLLGLVMLVLPGPGMLVVAAGLVILAEDIAWADRMLRFVRRKVPGVPEDGRIPRSTLLVGAMLTLAGIAATVWYTTR